MKRIRVTRRGKLVARRGGQDHFNARDDRRARTKKGRTTTVTMTRADRARFLPGS
ncbi:MAG: hypothetical protein AAB923_03720 [Patescibacteria group bacterium]